MKNFIFCLALLVSTAAFAEDAGELVTTPGAPSAGIVIDAGTVTIEMPELPVSGSVAVDAGVAPIIPAWDEPLESMKGFVHAVKTGNGWLIAMFLLFFLVGFIRIVGKRVHAMIPDDTAHWFLKPVEKVFFFIFDTKIGGWSLNWLSAVGGCLSTAALAGVPVDADAWKVALMASTGGTTLIELKDDVMEWWDARIAAKAAAAAEEAAKKAAVVTPVAPAEAETPPPAIPPVEPPTP